MCSDVCCASAESEAVRTESIERAFRLVDRALFLPTTREQPVAGVAMAAAPFQQPAPPLADSQQPQAPAPGLRVPRATRAQIDGIKQQAYIDAPIKIDNVHISAPHMYATVLERLAIKPGEGSRGVSSLALALQPPCSADWLALWSLARVCAVGMSFLNLGSGSGYLSCMAAVLVGSSGASHGVELRSDVVKHARRATATWIRRIKRWKRQQQEMDEMEAEQNASAEASPAAAAGSRKRKMEEEGKEESDADEEIDAGANMTDVPSSSVPSGSTASAVAAAAASTSATPSSLPAPIAVPAAVAAPSADPTGSPLPSPSPTPSVHSTSGESHSSEVGGAGASWTPDFPITSLPAVPQFIEGDVFDLAREEAAQKYDRVYIGASLPSRYLPVFAQLLHPGGRLVAPFGSSMQMVVKRKDGSLKVEHVASVGYAELLLPDDENEATEAEDVAAPASASTPSAPAAATAAAAASSTAAAPTTPPKPRLVFPRVAFQASDEFSSLPSAMREAMHAILMLQARDGAVSLPGRLPVPLWTHILGFCSRDDWMDRARGLVPWSIPPTDLLRQAQSQLNKANERATTQKWREADACLKECNRLLDLAREEATLGVTEAELTTGGAASPTPSPPIAAATSVPSSGSPLLAQLQSLQHSCWRAELCVLTHLGEHARAVRVATSLLERSGLVTKHSDEYRAILVAKAQAQLKTGEPPDALETWQQLQSSITKQAAAESQAAGGGAGASSTPAAAASSAATPSFTSASAPAPSVSAGSLAFDPLPVPSVADVADLRSKIDLAFPAYRQRESSQRNRLLRFMAGAFMIGVRQEAEEEEEEQP